MRSEGKLRDRPDGGKEVYHEGTDSWHPLEDCDMGHKEDAVKYWNETGYKKGAKSKEVRDWMKDPDNYELEPSSINRSRGAKLKDRYRPPEPEGGGGPPATPPTP